MEIHSGKHFETKGTLFLVSQFVLAATSLVCHSLDPDSFLPISLCRLSSSWRLMSYETPESGKEVKISLTEIKQRCEYIQTLPEAANAQLQEKGKFSVAIK